MVEEPGGGEPDGGEPGGGEPGGRVCVQIQKEMLSTAN